MSFNLQQSQQQNLQFQQQNLQFQQQNIDPKRNANIMPHPSSLVFVEDGFSQLKRDWEHAFHVQSLQGRETEHLQRLMHSQFTFLEHVVLDVSKQCHSLQDQLVAERNANKKLLDQMEEIQKYSSSLKDPIIDLENKFTKLDANQQILLSQQKGLDAAINTHGAALQSKLNEKSNQEKDLISRMSPEMDALRKEIAELKFAIENEKQQRLADKSQLDVMIEDVKKEIASLHLNIQTTYSSILKETRDLTDQTSQALERQFLSHKHAHHNEQQTVLAVIKTMSNNISTLRKELHRIDSKSLARLEEFKNTILTQFKQEVKTVTRPLIVH